MNNLKKRYHKWQVTRKQLKDPLQKKGTRIGLWRGLRSYFSARSIFILGGLSVVAQIAYLSNNDMGSRVSKMTGYVMNAHLPKFILSPMIHLYSKILKVNLEEMAAGKVSDFNTFNEFFTRKLKEGIRTIDEQSNPRSICSPCDGSVFNFGICKEDTFVLVKGTEYTLDDFLFGQTIESKKYFTSVLEKVKERNNELAFILLYLSPSEYHRYHSPASFTTNYRRHIPGKLLPVNPIYVRRNPNVFKVNERVNLFGEWIHGFFSASFIGATNVGSIVINFDKDLITNSKKFTNVDYQDKNYIRMTELDGIFKNNLIIKKNAIGENEEDIVDISRELSLFDIKDIIDVEHGQNKLIYHESQEDEMQFNLKNCFKGQESEAEYDEYQTELIGKLEDSRDTIVQKYAFTNKGIALEKGDEIGMFRMGSSIMLIFEVPKDTKFDVEVGQSVKLGNKLLSTT